MVRREFIAERPGWGPYSEAALGFLKAHGIQGFDDLEEIPTLPSGEAESVCAHLLSLAGQAQNVANITIGRYCIQQLPVDWLLDRIERLAEPLLAEDDEWEYRRLLELYSTLDAELTRRLVDRARQHENEDIREAGIEFADG